MVQLNVRVRAATKQQAQDLAKATGMSLATVIERGINQQTAVYRFSGKSWDGRAAASQTQKKPTQDRP